MSTLAMADHANPSAAPVCSAVRASESTKAKQLVRCVIDGYGAIAGCDRANRSRRLATYTIRVSQEVEAWL